MESLNVSVNVASMEMENIVQVYLLNQIILIEN